MTLRFKPRIAAALAISVIFLGACAHIPVRPNIYPPEEDGEVVVGEPEVETKMSATHTEFANEGLLSSDLQYFDASKVRAYIGDSNITITSTNSTLVATLRSGTTAVASNSFAVYRSGDNIYFSNPSAVTAWVRSMSGVANAFDLEVSAMNYQGGTGTNTYVVEVFYDADLVGGGAASRYIPPPQCQVGYCIEP